MRKSPEHKATWKDWTLIGGVLLLVVVLLFAPLFAKADERQHATVLICDIHVTECTLQTARIVFVVPLEGAIGSGCLFAAQTKIAQVASLMAETETTKILCPRG